MGALRITNFGGIIPRLGKRMLPDNAAQYALNAKLLSGELRPHWNPRLLGTIVSPSNAQDFYVFSYEGNDYFMGFNEPTNVVRAPLINDAYDRLYLSDSTGPYITTKDDIAGDTPAPRVRLGIPPPSYAAPFSVNATGGTAALAESRVYTVILVSKYGEEGPAETVVLASGNSDGTWTIDDLDLFEYDDTTYANVTKLRLYRTVTSATGVDYRQVIEWDVGSVPNSYVDNVASTVVAAAPALQSLSWTPPPVDLQGLQSAAGGFLAGFRGRTIYFSEPYYPHAWPEEYQQAVEEDIVALGVFGNAVVVLTTGRPQVAVGTTPAAMSFVKLEGGLPCNAARSVVNTSSAVLYSTLDGLAAISDNGFNLVSRAHVTRDEWRQFATEDMCAGTYNDRYLGFYGGVYGFSIGFDDPVTGFTEVQNELPVLAIRNDPFTGRTLYLTSENRVFEWDGTYGDPMTFMWRSKPFLTPKPCNFGAGQIRADFAAEVTTGSSNTVIPYGHALNGEALNTYPINNMSSVISPPDMPTAVTLRVYGDGVLRETKVVSSEEAFRFGSGYVAVQWEYELSGAVSIYSLVVAGTMKELEQLP